MARVTLTFDNGPEPEVTPYVLDVLAKHGIAASFFVIGAKLENPPARACAERARSEGHWIGNHSYTHTESLGDAGGEGAFDEEVEKTQSLLGSLAHPDRLFRPYCNSGVLDARVFKRADIARLQRGRYSCILFNAIVRDWEDGDGWPQRAMSEIASRDWTTLVLHDIPKTNAMRRLDAFIARARDAGHDFVQEISPDSVPLRRGEILAPMDAWVSD